jgi:hypothetical protein
MRATTGIPSRHARLLLGVSEPACTGNRREAAGTVSSSHRRLNTIEEGIAREGAFVPRVRAMFVSSHDRTDHRAKRPTHNVTPNRIDAEVGPQPGKVISGPPRQFLAHDQLWWRSSAGRSANAEAAQLDGVLIESLLACSSSTSGTSRLAGLASTPVKTRTPYTPGRFSRIVAIRATVRLGCDGVQG